MGITMLYGRFGPKAASQDFLRMTALQRKPPYASEHAALPCVYFTEEQAGTQGSLTGGRTGSTNMSPSR